MPNKANLYLMTQKGFSVLEALIYNGLHKYINQVIVGEDKHIDKDFSEEIIDLCKKNKIAHVLRNATLPAAYSFAVSWRWIINCDGELIVLHDSLLPKYRGFAPLVNQLINGEREIGVSAIFAEKEYDKGRIIAQEKLQIAYPVKIGEVIEKMAVLYAKLVLSLMNRIFLHNENLEGKIQDESQSSYSLWRDAEDYKIDWNRSADYIKRFIDAVGSPYKGAMSLMEGKPIRIFSASEREDVNIENRHPGKIIFMENGFPVIVCGTGLLKITEACFEDTKESIFPLKKFRIRLG